MKKTTYKYSIISASIFILLMFSSLVSTSQEVEAKPKIDHSYKPLTLKLNKDGSKYIRFITWHQIWMTTNNLSDDNANPEFNFSLRRSRFIAFAQISPKFLILTHFGLNSLTPANLSSLGNNSDAPQIFLHDAWGELQLFKKKLYIGAGLHYWKGLTRLSNQSTLNFMTLDQSRPFSAWHSLGITDQFARHLGVYIKGELGKFEYRVALNNPGRNPLGGGTDYSGKFNPNGTNQSNLMYTGASTPNANGDAVGNAIIEGYFQYNIFDKESTKLPYKVGTYFGKKKILAIGAGFFSHPNGMYDTVDKKHSSVLHFAGDIFADMPAPGGSFNAYVSVMNFNYGTNYISRWAGSGTTIYGQLGYFLKKLKIMPYIAYQTANYEAAKENVTAIDAGINYYINGHFCKITAEYHSIINDFREGALTIGGQGTLSQFRLQLHIFL